MKHTGGVGPYTYSWGIIGSGQLKGNLSGKNIYLFEPYGPTKVYVSVDDAGTGCVTNDTIDIGWDDQYFCGTLNPRTYSLVVCEDGVTKCVPWATAKSLIKGGIATLGPCAQPTKMAPGSIHATLYPNPTQDVATLEFQSEKAGIGTLLVMDMSGRILQHAKVNLNTGVQYQNIDLSGMPNGLYIVRLNTDHDVFTERLQLIK